MCFCFGDKSDNMFNITWQEKRLILYIPPYTFLLGGINMGTSRQKRINSAFLKYHWSMQLQCLPVLNTWKYRKRFLYVPWRCFYSNTGNRCEYKREGMCFHKAKSMWEVFKMVTKLLLQSLIEDCGPTLFLGALYILLWRPYWFEFSKLHALTKVLPLSRASLRLLGLLRLCSLVEISWLWRYRFPFKWRI